MIFIPINCVFLFPAKVQNYCRYDRIAIRDNIMINMWKKDKLIVDVNFCEVSTFICVKPECFGPVIHYSICNSRNSSISMMYSYDL